MLISIVSTLYLSENTMEEFCIRMQKSVEEITLDYEFILVDDGSPDNSYILAQKLANLNKKIKLIQFSRNYGHHRAIYAGLDHSQGELIYLIDSDLQEEPESFKEFYDLISQQKDLDAAIGIQEQRKKSFLDTFASIYYKLFNSLSDVAYQKENLMTLRIMKRRLVDAFLKYKDKEIYFAPIFSISGFNQVYIPQKKIPRKKTTYSFLKRYNIFINAILSFSSKPLYFVFYSGLFTTFLSLIFVIYIIYLRIFSDSISSGWSSLMVSLWLIGGIIITFIGLVAIYINKIYMEVKNRPLYTIKKSEGFPDS